MARNREHLEGLLDLINKISKEDGNQWFLQNLAKNFSSYQLSSSNGSESNLTDDVPKNIQDIKNYLYLDTIQIIDYSKIKNEKTKVQLHMDCIQMGRFRLGKIDNRPNFDEFCRYAHLQAEELVNYYFKEKFKTLESVHIFLKQNNLEYRNKNLSTPRSISSINYSYKLWALNNLGLINDYIKSDLFFLNKIRNEISHRSTSELAVRDEEDLIYQFIKRFNKRYLTTNEIKKLSQDEYYLYLDGLHLKRKKEEQWDEIYNTLQNLLTNIISALN